ncbi:MAG: hypothetical protein ACM34A_12155 [Bacillota bacterium]
MNLEEMQAATPAEQVSAEQDAQVATTSAEETTEQTQEQQASQDQQQETPEEKAKKEPWFQKRIGELTREKYEAKRAAEEAKQQAEQYRQYLAQLQQGEQPPQQPEVDVRTLAQQEAAKMLAEQRFNESCNKVYAAGKTEFPDFDQAVANLQMVGVNRDFLELTTTSDAGAKLLHHLGTDLDEAARILALHPVQMARELTKLEFKLSQPQAKPVSKAPAPIKPIGTGGVTESGLSDDLPIDEWMRRHAKRK